MPVETAVVEFTTSGAEVELSYAGRPLDQVSSIRLVQYQINLAGAPATHLQYLKVRDHAGRSLVNSVRRGAQVSDVVPLAVPSQDTHVVFDRGFQVFSGLENVHGLRCSVESAAGTAVTVDFATFWFEIVWREDVHHRVETKALRHVQQSIISK